MCWLTALRGLQIESVLGVEDLRLILVLANEIDCFTRCGNLYWLDWYANMDGAPFF